MDFPYFPGPVSEMAGAASDGEQQCHLCGRVDHCFDLDRAPCECWSDDDLADLGEEVAGGEDGHARAGGPEEPALRFGCRRCVQDGRIAFAHGTEVGRITPEPALRDDVADDDGVNGWYLPAVIASGAVGWYIRADGPGHVPAAFSRDAVLSLALTPQISTWQEERWLVHCDDFMAYLGRWLPADFAAEGPDGDAKALFAAMSHPVSPEDLEFWDRSAALGDWDFRGWVAYLAFRCRHCGELRGYLDFD